LEGPKLILLVFHEHYVKSQRLLKMLVQILVTNANIWLIHASAR